jgi:Domain of unknown function (DUF4249)
MFRNSTYNPIVKLISYGFLAIFLNACVSPFDAMLEDSVQKLVVDGQISTLAGAANTRVSIRYSTAFSNESKDIPYPKGAKVYVTDNQGNKENFVAGNLGEYLPENAQFKGIPTRTYTLHIETLDGKKYESKPELMKTAPPIDTVYLVYKEKFTDKGANYQRYFDVIVETNDPPTAGDLYRWNWVHYEQINTCRIFIYYPPGSPVSIRQRFPCCEKYCFDIYNCLGCVNLGNDNLVNGRKISSVIMQLNYDAVTPFYLLVQQQSISADAYKFWRAVGNQVQNSGGVFDTPPASIPGNVVNVNDPQEQVLGFFGATSVSQKAVYLDRSFAFNKLNKYPYNFNLINKSKIRPYEAPDQPYAQCSECKESLFRTQQIPFGWRF